MHNKTLGILILLAGLVLLIAHLTSNPSKEQLEAARATVIKPEANQ